MLIELTIENIALIASLKLSFHEGFSVLTGETGAGKSILIDALGLVLGGRADRGLVRAGTEKATVEALFDITASSAAQALLEEWGVDASDGTAILCRELTASGRSVCRISGAMVTAAQLKTLSSLLVDLHGQHEHQRLLDRSAHRAWIGDYAGETLLATRERCSQAYEAWRGVRREIASIGGSEQERERRADMLRYQIQEIEEAKIKPGEQDELSALRNRLRHAERIAEQTTAAWEKLWQGSGRGASARDLIAQAAAALQSVADLDEKLADVARQAEEVGYSLEGAADALRSVVAASNPDPGELDRVENRLELLSLLRRKYGPTLEDVLAFLNDARAELDSLERSEETLERLSKREREAHDALTGLCEELSQMRLDAGRRMAAEVESVLAQLGMEKTKVDVRVARLGTPERHGWDEAELMIAPNVGEPMKPLAAIASGGEMSRVMLALKTIGAQQSDVGTLIFDEIDTGVSGRIAQAVAEAMAGIATSRQVLCVTHLPQIAAMGARHYLVRKTEAHDRTETHVVPLDDESRVVELARMIGGVDEVSDTALRHAHSLLAAQKKSTKGLEDKHA